MKRRKRMKQLIKYIVVCGFALLGFSACYRVENICNEESELLNLTIKTDWRNLEEEYKADARTYLSFYCMGKMEREVEHGDEEYTISFAPNVYSVLLLNTNRKNIQINNADQFDVAEASVIETTSTRSGEAEALAPSALYCAKLPELSLESSQSVTMAPDPYFKKVTFNVTIDSDVDILTAGGYLTGAAKTIQLSTAQTSTETVSHAYTLTHEAGNLWAGTLTLLGLSSDTTVRNLFTVEVEPDGSEPIELSEDITQKLRDAFANNWQITLNINISVTTSPTGFTMTLVSWSTSATGGGTIQ